ncbi:hypothetical protein M011DRAFT_527152 [Sporormia fimetaria CBS 119925]|uniref:Origin recognition complex subunit 4 n=1 Tax=Sporormia fimetaria CBS 119925 TaxID=1340428 RepID=A0A6A6V6Q9_9PLEO|nr:hypothetical protein M011DRAFT_527152 [Sporormia fimetaria CBS 119925]
MDDIPRSSKRRKLDTPTQNPSSPPAPASLRKPSGRLRTPSTKAKEIAGVKDDPSPVSRGRLRNAGSTAANGTPKKHARAEEIDVYDDIEGALPPLNEPIVVQRRTSRSTRAENAREVKDVEPRSTTAKETPRKRRKGPPTATNGQSDERESADPLQQDSSVGRTAPRLRSVRKAPTSRPQKQKEEVVAEEENPVATTPIRRPTRRSAVSDSEDELGDRIPPSTSKSARLRRVGNRADHIYNREELGTGSQSEEDVVELGASNEMENRGGLEFDGNSVAGSVLDPTEPSPFNRPSSARKPESEVFHKNLADGPELNLLKSIVLERVMGKRSAPLVGLDEEYSTVYQLVEHTITAGEGNSMLLIGARGSGKTLLVNKVLSEVSKANREDYHVVRLNGFIHTDDKIALREIWRQLGKEMDIEEDGGIGKNYADTLATLLALLSHPSEQTGELTDQVAKAVIFIIDEFDLFALHPRQTLLYNLFDIAQSRKAPIAVLGLTTRIDVANSLEKRVKSRFSHRYVHLSLAKSFSAYREMCKASLLVQPHDLSLKERAILLPEVGTATPAKRGRTPKTPKTRAQDVLAAWNDNVSSLFASKSFLTTHLAPHYYLSKSVPVALTSFLLPVAMISSSHPSLSFSADSTYSQLVAPDSKLSVIPSLSTLALSLLIGAARLDILHDADTCNFNMAYDEYVTLASKARVQSAAGGATASGAVSKVWGKDVAKREWESLVELGLLVPVVAGQGLGQGGFGMCKCDVSLEEIGVVASERGLEKVVERWCRQL